jgi:ribulose-phosphate 3-epimerase
MSVDSVYIAPSILSADILKLGEDLDAIATADYIHVDVMDGSFVPNLTFGPNVVKAVKKRSALPADVHLMIDNPDETIGLYLDAGADLVTFHIEAATHANRIVSAIHAAGAKAGVSLNPATPVCLLDAIIEDIDMVLIMSVNPGFGGQSYIPYATEKIRQVKRMCEQHKVNPLIEVDGGVSAKNIAEVVAAGANVIVAGSAVYNKEDRAAAIQELRDVARAGLGRSC